MKKLTMLLIVIIIANCISISSLAYDEPTKDEFAVYYSAIRYINKVESNIYCNTDFDLSSYTIEHFGTDSNVKKEILEKAKEYENEIRANHLYRYHEDSEDYWATEETDEYGNFLPPADQSKVTARQYDNVPIEDVISSFPTFIKKKVSYWKTVESSKTYSSFSYHELFERALPYGITVSESGFAYINYSGAYMLLYRYKAPSEDMWLVCDYSIFWDDYDEEYRFHSEDMDVEKELIAKGFTPLSADVNSDSDSDTDTEVDSASDSESETEAPPQDEKSNNFITWILCAESTIILVLALVLAFKKKK